MLAGVGGYLKLERAARTRNFDLESFLNLLQQKVADSHQQVDVTMKNTIKEDGEVTISGLLPCPVRLPLLEGFDRFVEQYSFTTGWSVSYRFEAASLGSAWMDENIRSAKSPDQLPDIFVSAGFETFFDPETIGRFKDDGIFCDLTKGPANADFDGLGLKDPKGHYSLISVVPSAFMVNHDELAGLPVPRTWADILNPEDEQKGALPGGYFDVVNPILRTIHSGYGDEGVRRLVRFML